MNLTYRFCFYLKNWRLLVRRFLFRQRLAVEVGRHSYGVPALRWWGERVNLRIGAFCSIACDVTIFLGGNHRTDWISTFPFLAFKRWNRGAHSDMFARWKNRIDSDGHLSTRGDVVIGNDVWLGEGCTILSGVHVGDGAVVATRAVVTKDIPPYAIVAGNPARVVGERFTQAEIDRLLELRWWDWDDAAILGKLDVLQSAFVSKLQASPGGSNGNA